MTRHRFSPCADKLMAPLIASAIGKMSAIRRRIDPGRWLPLLLIFGSLASLRAESRPPEGSEEQSRAGGRLVELEIAQLKQDLQLIQDRAAPLDAELDGLLKQLRKLELPQAAGRKAGQAPRETEFRTPLVHVVTGRKSRLYVCKNNRLAWIDLDAIERLVHERAGEASPLAVLRVPSGDFNFRDVNHRKGTLVSGRLDPKPQQPGETVQVFSQQHSRMRRALAAGDPGRYVVRFAVYPDSFEIFRIARQAAWDEGFEVGWIPARSGKPLILGPGKTEID